MEERGNVAGRGGGVFSPSVLGKRQGDLKVCESCQPRSGSLTQVHLDLERFWREAKRKMELERKGVER